MIRKLLIPIAVVGALVAAPAAHALETISVERRPFTAAGYKNVIAWSSYDPAVSAYRLKLQVGTRIVTPSVPPRAVPFDVNVGPLPSGRGYGVVYSRCREEQATGRVRGCDIHALDVQAGTESRLPSSSGIRDEYMPAIHGSFVSFARTYPARRGRRGTRDVVYKARTDGEGGSRRLPTPESAAASVGAMDIGSSGRVAYTWSAPNGEFATSTLYRVRTGDRRLQRVYRARSGGLNSARTLSPTVSGTNLYWARTNSGSGTGNRIFRFNVGNGRYEEARSSSRYVSVSYLGGQGFATASAIAGETCTGSVPEDNDLSKSECRLERLTSAEVTFRRATSPLGLSR